MSKKIVGLVAIATLMLGGGCTRTPDASSAEARPDPEPLAAAATEPAPAPPPLVELLHAVPSTVVVSSVYRDDARQGARLVDGDLTSAWNSRTGDLEGAWVEFQLPDDARVHEVWLTVGFTRSSGATDLFTGNHRVAEVRVTRGDADLGTHALDVGSRELQRIAVASTGTGGTYRITLTRLLPGSRSDWREAIVSELRVMGTASNATPGAHTPAVRAAQGVGAANGSTDTATTQAAPAPATAQPAAPLGPPVPAPPLVSDALYVMIRGRGLARLANGGVEVLVGERVADFALGTEQLYVLRGDGRGLYVFAGGERREHALPTNERFHLVAIGLAGAPVIASSFGIWRWSGGAWGSAETMDASARGGDGEQPQQLVVGPNGFVWARGQDSLFRGNAGVYRREYLPERIDARIASVAVGPTGIVAAVDARELFVRGASSPWRQIDSPLGDAAVREVAVGADGTVVAGAYDGVFLVPPEGAPQAVPLEDAGIITALARDVRGHTYVGSTGGLFLLAADGSRLAHVPSLAGFEGTIDMLAVAGVGPESLPAAP